MQVKNLLCTMALSCGLVALPALAQSSPQSSTSSNPSSSSSPTSDQTSSSASGQTSSGTTASTDYSSIKSNVQSALHKDDQLAGQNVNAQVSNQKITLSGAVSSRAQKDHAEQVVTKAAPGYTVKNKIKVSGASASNSSQPKQ